MWPFGKKKENNRQELAAREQQVQQFARQFDCEEITLVAVTGPEGIRTRKEDGEELVTLTVPLTAWMDDDDGIVHEEPATLVTLADERLQDFLQNRIPRDFIIKVKGRAALEGRCFQLTGMPEPGFDPELKAILDRQKSPVTVQADGLGEFALVRTTNWFEMETKWLDRTVLLAFDADQEREGCFATARQLLKDAAGWDARLREFAAKTLLDEINRQSEDQLVTLEQLQEDMEPDAILVNADGGVTAWLGSDLLWGRSAQVMGSIEGGPERAKIEE